jgi:hypothetical protein
MSCTATAELTESKLEGQAPHHPSQIRQLKWKAARNSRFLAAGRLEVRFVGMRRSESRVASASPPLPQPLQRGPSAPEAPYRLAVPARMYRDILGFVADVNACRMGMAHFHAEVFTLDLPHRLAPLRAVHLIPMAAR